MYSKRGRHKLIKAYLFGVASLVAVEGIVAGILQWPPTYAVHGIPHALAREPIAEPEPLAAPPRDSLEPPAPQSVSPSAPAPVSPAPAPARAFTITLPGGATADLVRQDVVDGVLPVPERLHEAAWWGADLHAQRGASVFAGHVDWGGRTGPFAELWTERIGGEITVVDGEGRSSAYRISQLFSLKKDELPERAADLFAQTGAHRIVLVTCGGEWVGGARGYAENRVVVADPA
jgi:hypothetical protein